MTVMGRLGVCLHAWL